MAHAASESRSRGCLRLPTFAPQIFLTSDRLLALIHRGTALAALNACELAILSPAELVCVGARKSCLGCVYPFPAVPRNWRRQICAPMSFRKVFAHCRRRHN